MMDPTLIPVYIINTTPVNYTPDRATRIYVLDLTWGGDTLDAGGWITLMRNARSRSGAELLLAEEGG